MDRGQSVGVPSDASVPLKLIMSQFVDSNFRTLCLYLTHIFATENILSVFHEFVP